MSASFVALKYIESHKCIDIRSLIIVIFLTLQTSFIYFVNCNKTSIRKIYKKNCDIYDWHYDQSVDFQASSVRSLNSTSVTTCFSNDHGRRWMSTDKYIQKYKKDYWHTRNADVASVSHRSESSDTFFCSITQLPEYEIGSSSHSGYNLAVFRRTISS